MRIIIISLCMLYVFIIVSMFVIISTDHDMIIVVIIAGERLRRELQQVPRLAELPDDVRRRGDLLQQGLDLVLFRVGSMPFETKYAPLGLLERASPIHLKSIETHSTHRIEP